MIMFLSHQGEIWGNDQWKPKYLETFLFKNLYKMFTAFKWNKLKKAEHPAIK